MVRFVRDLAPTEKLELYKKIKGFCLCESSYKNGCLAKINMKQIMDEKVKDVVDVIINYDMETDYMEVYKDYSYGRI